MGRMKDLAIDLMDVGAYPDPLMTSDMPGRAEKIAELANLVVTGSVTLEYAIDLGMTWMQGQIVKQISSLR